MSRANFHHACKLPLFRFDYLRNAIRTLLQLRIRATHFIAYGIHHIAHEWLLLAELTAVPYAATENLAKHVAAAFIRRQHAVGDEERRAAGMVSDDAQ